MDRVIVMEAGNDLLGDRGGYRVPIKGIEGMENTDPIKFRFDYAKRSLDRLITGFSNSGWGSEKERDPDYSDYSTTKVVGDKAETLGIKLLDLAKKRKIEQDEEDFPDEGFQKTYRFEIPGLEDAQLFYNDSKDPNKDELILVVRPLEIKKEVTIVI